jgi:hypothetical protein
MIRSDDMAFDGLAVHMNGQARSATGARRTAKRGVSVPLVRGKRRSGMRYSRRLAAVLGGIQAGLLGLSVVHCTESIGVLTGSHWALAGLLAVGIDAGMLGSEAAEIVAHGRKGCSAWVQWAKGYTIGTVLLSMVLNGYAFSHHAPDGMSWAGWSLGAFVPALLYALGRVACGLWLSGE